MCEDNLESSTGFCIFFSVSLGLMVAALVLLA